MALQTTVQWRYIKILLWSTQVLIVLLVLIKDILNFYKLQSIETETQMSSQISIENVSKSTFPPSATIKISKSKSFETTKSSSFDSNISKTLLFLPILSYIFYVLTGIVTIMDISNIFSCYIGATIPSICYATGKAFMYLVFIFRLKTVYS
eukprot:527505_1